MSGSVGARLRPKRLALCLSGGGFRASLFHAGALKRLNELGVLSQVETLYSVSGGSIANGVLATRWVKLKASERDGVFDSFDELVVKPICKFCEKDLRTEVLLWDRVNPINWPQLLRRDYSVTDRLAATYAQDLQLDIRLADLPASPDFVFLATNMKNGGPWIFSAEKMGDYYTGYLPPKDTTVATSVAASSAYPVTFPPLQIVFDPPATFEGGHPETAQRIDSVTLTDGGVYDNLGLEEVRNGHDWIFVSDAGLPLLHEELPNLGLYPRIIRSLYIIWNQVGAQRKRWLIDAFKAKDAELAGAYWGLTSKVANFDLPDAPSYGPEVQDLIEHIRTDLDPFSEGEVGCLMNHGYALANVAVRRWAKHLLPDPVPDFEWPYEKWTDPAVALEALRNSSQRGVVSDIWGSLKRHAEKWF